MEKIYVITIESVYDSASEFHQPIAYKKKVDAEKKFNALVDKFISDYPEYVNEEESLDLEDELFLYERSRDCFHAYENGRSAENHYDITLTELDLL